MKGGDTDEAGGGTEFGGGDDRAKQGGQALHRGLQASAEPEFDSGRWVDYWSPVREVIYFKRAVYARALQELGCEAAVAGRRA